MRNENDRVLVDAEWNSLSFAGEQTLLVSRRTGGALRYGMIQINENVRIPFAYSSITPLTGQILAAVTAEDEKTILYNTEGQQLLSQAWDSCVAEDGVLRLMSGTAQYTAEVSGSTIRMMQLPCARYWQESHCTFPLTLRIWQGWKAIRCWRSWRSFLTSI